MTLFNDDMRRNPYPMYEQLRAASPMHIAAQDLWLVLDYDGVKRALHDPESFSSSVGGTRGNSFEWLLFMDPPRHTKLRAIISRAFTPRSIAALEPRIRELARGLIEPVLAKDVVDVEAELAAPLPIMVIAEMLGLPTADWKRVEGWADAIMGLADTIMGTPAAADAASAEFARANAEMQEYLVALVAARVGKPTDDLISRLVHAEVDGEHLSDLELLRFFQLLLAAGAETTTNLIDNTLVCLADHPEQWAKLRANPALLPSALEEVLRFRSPAQAMFRATTREVELGGKTIPAGKMVLALIGAANRDPKQFVDAARFDITREPNPHVAFGHGIHFCLGAALSRLEARVAFEELLPRITNIAYASDAPWSPRKPFHVHGPASLPMRLSR
jgi:cytochrome P450